MMTMSTSSTASSSTASASSSGVPIASPNSGEILGGTTSSQNGATGIVSPPLALNAVVAVGLVAVMAFQIL